MRITTYISLGKDVDLALDVEDNLVVVTSNRGVVTSHISLGPCTEARVKEIHEYLDRLAALSSKIKP